MTMNDESSDGSGRSQPATATGSDAGAMPAVDRATDFPARPAPATPVDPLAAALARTGMNVDDLFAGDRGSAMGGPTPGAWSPGGGQPFDSNLPTDADDPEFQGFNPHVKRYPTDRFTPAQVVAALEASAGLMVGAAQKLRCTRQTVYNYVERIPWIKQELSRIEEERLDLAEGGIIARMADDSQKAVHLQANMFYLKMKGHKRGYTEKLQHQGDAEKPIHVKADAAVDIKWDKLSVPEMRSVLLAMRKASEPEDPDDPEAGSR
jgi:hypothetical protein